MKTRIVTVVALALLAAGCRNDKKMQRGQQSYETVQEGSAAGVTSTISGPGETPPPLNSMTGTNADTTTSFTLPATVTDSSGSMQQPGSVAGTMPSYSTYPQTPAASRPRTTPPPRPRESHSDAPIATDTVAVPQQPVTTTHQQQPPPRTDTAPTTTTQTPPTQTDTAPPPPPPPSSEHSDQQQPQPATPPPPSTDTTSTKPPAR